MWFLDQQNQPYLKASLKCRISGLTQDPLNQNLCFMKIPRGFIWQSKFERLCWKWLSILLIYCYEMNVFPYNSDPEALMWWYLEMGFWEVTKSWRWCPLMRLVSLWGKQGSQLSLLSIFWSYNKNMIIHISGYARTLILGFAGFRTMRNECLLFKSTCGILL